MKTIVQFLQQMEPESQKVSSLLENLASMTGQEGTLAQTEELQDVKNLLQQSLQNIQNQVHEQVLDYIIRFQMSGVSSEQQQCHQLLQSLQADETFKSLLQGGLADSNWSFL